MPRELPLTHQGRFAQLEKQAFATGDVSVKVMVTETQTFFIAQFENLPPRKRTKMPEIIGVECPYCQRTIDDELATIYIYILRLDAIRFNLIQVQVLVSKIESQCTLYQPEIRRLCGESNFLLAENLSAVRSTIEEAKHQRLQPKLGDMPVWW